MAGNRAVIHGIESLQKLARQKNPDVEFEMPEISTSREAPKEGIWEQKTGTRKVGPDGGGTFNYWERQPDIEKPAASPQPAAAPSPKKAASHDSNFMEDYNFAGANSKYANARDRAKSYSNQKAGLK